MTSSRRHTSTLRKIKKVLIANRGEITHRIAKTLQKLKIKSVGLCIPDERHAGFLKLCDEIKIFSTNDLSAYLHISNIIQIAKDAEVDAIHPGYGFLSENAGFAAECIKNGIIFLGPLPETIELMGNKHQAKEFAKQNEIPVLETVVETQESDSSFEKKIRALPLPIILKPLNGGGGKGMTTVREFTNLSQDLEQARSVAKKSFGDSRLLAEPLIEQALHLEIQIIGDQHGNVCHLFERDCTIQRRHQKIIEESPSPIIQSNLLQTIYEDATRLAENCKYQSLGTVEFILDQNHKHYFMEMNTRLQVEHPVTEMTTGLDLVEKQIEIAAGKTLDKILPKKITRKKHAMEVRIYSENPSQDFIPSTGTISILRLPKDSKNVRIDCGVEEGTKIHHMFDPMIMKITVSGKTREDASETLIRTLQKTTIFGIQTNLNYLQWVLRHKDFVSGQHYTSWTKDSLPSFQNLQINRGSLDSIILSYAIEQNRQTSDWYHDPWLTLEKLNPEMSWKKNSFSYSDHDGIHVGEIWNDLDHHWISVDGWTTLMEKKVFSFDGTDETSSNHVKAPMTGTIVKLHAQEGEKTSKGDLLVEMEAMKMQYKIISPRDAIISKVLCSEKEIVEHESTLIELSET